MKTAIEAPPASGNSSKKSAAKRNPGKARITSILVPLDFSEPSKRALEYAVALAKQFRAKITPLFVVEPPETIGLFQLMMDEEDIIAGGKAKLLKFCRKALVPASHIDRPLVRKGRAHREIAEAARMLKVDLIVIATHGYSGVTRAFLGSVTERVVREAPCPVLVVRDHEHQFVTS